MILLSCLTQRSNSRNSDISNLTRSESSTSSASFIRKCPELLLGLSYNGTTGRLQVSVIKGSQLKSSSSHSSWSHGSVSSSLAASLKAPDIYIKLTLMSSSGQELARSKTSLKKGQPNPIFKETFVFQVRPSIYCLKVMIEFCCFA